MPSMYDYFEGHPPKWLVEFVSDPERVVREALDRSYWFGSLNAVDPDQLLVDWLECGLDEFTPAHLDDVLERIARSHYPLVTSRTADLPVQRAFWLRVIHIATWAGLPSSLAYLTVIRAEIAGLGGKVLQLELSRLSAPSP